MDGDITEQIVNNVVDSLRNGTSGANLTGAAATDDVVANNLANLDVDNDPAFPSGCDEFIDGGCPAETLCKRILWEPVHRGSSVRSWDVLVLIPNVVFLILLVVGSRRARTKLRATHSLILGAFYSLVLTNTVVSVVRCLVAMTFSAYPTSEEDGNPFASHVDKLMWIILRFFLFATEMSVIVFAVASGHLDSKASIRRVVLVSSCISLMYSICQCVLEFSQKMDVIFDVKNGGARLYAHGGSIFWMTSSLLFGLFYLSILLLPLTPCSKYFSLPNKSTFYYYVGFLAALNILQWIGSLEIILGTASGLCLVNFTTFTYYTAFTPVVYITFLRSFFREDQSDTPAFLYKAQVNDYEEELMASGSVMQTGNTPIIINGYRRLETGRKVEDDGALMETVTPNLPGNM